MKDVKQFTPKNLRGKVTKTIINDLGAAAVEAAKPALESEGVTETRREAMQKITKSIAKKPRVATEAQNARISWMNDIVNAAVSIKGAGKSVPDQWTSRKNLAGLTNRELWEIRGEATRMASSANKDKAVKKSLTEIRAQKAELMKGASVDAVEAGKVRINKAKLEAAKKKVKAAKESQVQKSTDAGTALAICPLCGSATFDAAADKCPVCKENYKKYRAVEAADFDFDEESEYTTIDIDGDEQILLDEDGNTSVVLPDQLEGKLVEHSHELVIESAEEPIIVDSGLASDHQEPDGDEDMFGDEPLSEENMDADSEVAFLKFPIGIEECLDLLQEGNEDTIEVVPTEDGYEIIIAAVIESVEEPVEFEEDAEDVDVVDMDEAAEGEFDVDADLDVEAPDAPGIILVLEELAAGTVLHVDGVANVDELVAIINDLLPETAELVDVSAVNESQDQADDAVDSDVEDAAEDLLEDDVALVESAQPKIDRVFRVTESGTIKIMKENAISKVSIKAVYESKFPKVTKSIVKKSGKIDAKGTKVENTLETISQHAFMKRGMEAVGSGLNQRKLLQSLWAAIQANKGNASALLNTLEASAKPEANAEDKPAFTKKDKPFVKKMDKVVKFGSKK